MGTINASRNLAATIGANLRIARADAGLTQHELAVRLGRCDAMAISRWERGVNRPSDENLFALAEVLGHDFTWFLTDGQKAAA